MAIDAYWEDTSRTIIRITVYHDWDDASFQDARQNARHLSFSVDHPVSLLVDLRQARRITGSAVDQICDLLRFDMLNNIQSGVIIGGNLLVKSGLETYSKNNFNTMVPVELMGTLEEAKAFLSGVHSLNETLS